MLRALLLLCALGLAGVAAIPLAGHLAGVQLMASSAPSTGGPVVLLGNNFVVALFWMAGWLTLALLCLGAAVAIDQLHRLLRLQRQQQREAARPTEPPRRPVAEEPPPAPPPRRAPQEPRFEPRVAARVEPEPALAPRRLEEPARPRGPVLRADR